MATSISQGLVGDPAVDGLFAGSKWTGTVTYSFTDSLSDYPAGYGGNLSPAGFAPVSPAEQQVINKALADVEAFTNLDIQTNVEAGISDGAADIRVARLNAANPTAFAYYPSNAPNGEGGDVWIGTSNTGYATPVLGDYAYLIHLQEIGYALGLKNLDPFAVNNLGYDSLNYTVMNQGYGTLGYLNEQYGFPQSYMRSDILALQKMYGADFGMNSGDSVYSWSPTTGEMFINGVGQGAPGANRIFLTIWDGGGNDTWDMSNYSTDLYILLGPGEASTLSSAQLAYIGGIQPYAHGNVYNAFQYDPDGTGDLPPDARSLIENAIGGIGNDWIVGNDADNILIGGAGNDHLAGGDGDDRLVGGSGDDTLDGGLTGNDWLVGGDGNDVLDGGGYGSKILDGGSGNDILKGSSQNADLFVVHDDGSSDFIELFRGNGRPDRVYVDFADVRSFEQLMAFATDVPNELGIQYGTNVFFDFGSAGSFTLGGMRSSLLREEDFIFSNPDPSNSTSAPTNITLSSAAVIENSPGARVGALKVTDPDGDTSFTFALSDDRFEVTFDYALKLKDGVQLDNEVESSIGIDVTATDPGGFSFQKHLTIQVSDGRDATIYGTNGSDLVDATHTVAAQSLPTEDDDIISGMDGNDTLYGLAGADIVKGDAGDDSIYGGDGNDSLGGGAGNDLLYGGDGSDLLRGDAGNDVLYAENGDDAIYGGAGNDFLSGGDGRDFVFGDAGDDSIYGGDGNDGCEGGDGNDSLYGGAGSDLLRGNAGNNVLYGGDGNDILTCDTFAGNDVFYGENGDDTIYAGAGNDFLYGGAGNDTLYGQAGVDYLDGGAGNDNFIGLEAFDTIFGGDGIDSFGSLANPIAPIVLQGFSPDNSIEIFWSSCPLWGTDTANTLDFSNIDAVGSSKLSIDGRGGNDTVVGNAADNNLDGGAGNDTLTGGAGDDLFFYRAAGGQDLITDFTAGGNVDEIYFGGLAGVRTFFQTMTFATQVGANAVFNFGGGQMLTLSNVTLGDLTAGDFAFSNPLPPSHFAPNDIALVGNTVAENAAGATIGIMAVADADGETEFTFTLSDNRFQVVNNSGNYFLKLQTGVALDYETEPSLNIDITAFDSGGLSRTEQFTVNVLDASGATINGTSGNNTIDGTQTVPGQSLPGDEADTINGLAGNDTLSGLGGNDSILGGTGNDILSGGDGNDTLNGQAGVDQLDGGNGNDTFVIAGTEALSDTMQGGAGTDTVQVTGTTTVTLTGFGPGNSIEAWLGNGAAVLGGSKTSDVLDFSNLTSKTGLLYIDAGGGNDTLTGSSLADDLRGGAGNDTISGGGDDDTLSGGAGVDVLDGGAGNDTFVITAAEAVSDTMLGGADTDAIQVGGTKAVTLGGFSAANSIEVWNGNNAGVIGSGVDNVLDFSGLTVKNGLLYVDGGNGNDTVTGTAFNDDLRGGGGNDLLNGGGGNDLLNGGKGADTFVFTGNFGNDTIATGFTAGIVTGHDVIQFDTAQFADFAAVQAHAAQVGTSVVITLDANNSVTLQSMTVAKLVAADFTFV